jgi:hypothetical protein
MDWTTNPQDEAALRAAFATSPDGRYRPITAWWWSGEKLEEERLWWQLDRIAELGCGGIAVTGLAFFGPAGGSVADDPPGFSDEWLRLYRMALERCRSLGLGAVSWSLFAGGFPVDTPALLKAHPEFRGERLLTRDGVAVQPFGYDFGNRRAVEALVGEGTVNGRHLAAIEDMLGDPIVLMFEDEIPAFPKWAPSFAAEFRERKGYDFPPRAFDQDVGPRTPALRWDLFDVATARVEGAYTEVTAAWVDKHKLLAGYDQMSRRGTPILSSAYYLDPFRTMAWANAPGTDQMGDARFHLSVADLTGASRVWLEGFHSHGWGMTLEHQARLLFEWGREGANLFLPHGMYYAGRAFWWEWAPPEMGWKQPYARHYPAFAEAVGRLNTALSSGRHVPEVAVLYPLSTVWAASTGHLEWGPEAHEAEAAYGELFGIHEAPSGQEPERPHRPSLLAEAGYDRIVVDEARIDAFDVPLIVAACRCLQTSTVTRLLALVAAGRQVIMVPPLPEWSAEVGRDDPAFAELVAQLADAAVVVDSVADVVGVLPPPRVSGLKSQWRRVGELDVVLLTGAGDARLRGMADRAPEQWDIMTGAVSPLGAVVDGDDLLVRSDGPVLLVALPAGSAVAPAVAPDVVVALPEIWECEYLPWGENRWGDYRLPANEGTPPVERRTFAFREGDDVAWRAAPVVPEDVQHPLTDLGFEDRMGQARSRPLPAERVLPDGWHEVVSTYGPKAVVDGSEGLQLAEYSERLGVEDVLLSTPIGLKGWVEPVKVDLGEQGGSVVSYGFVPEAADTHVVVEGAGVLTVWLDGSVLIGPVEGGVLSVPVRVEAGWHEVRIEVTPRHGVAGHLEGYRALPRTRLAWAFTEPYGRAPLGIWGGPVLHPDYKGSQDGRRFRRRVVVSEPAAVEVRWSAAAPVSVAVPDVLEPGEHWIDVFVGGAIHPAGFTAEVKLQMASGVVVIGTDDRWETAGAGEPWQRPVPIGMVGALGHAGEDDVFDEPARRSPLLDVAWLEGPDSVAGHVASLWADSPSPPPPGWFCFTAPPGAVSMTLPIVGSVSAWADGAPVSIVDGVLPLREGTRVALRVQAPAGYRGAACFTSHPLLELGPGRIRAGLSWHRQGLDCFSGVIRHRAVVTVPVGGGGPAVLDLGDVAGSVAVRVNGSDAGTRLWGPWRLPVTVRDGENEIELEIANTLGPMTARGIPTPFGPEDQRFSGLLEQPRLLLWSRS